ncbi:MAG: type VI secretion system protein TssA [Polyangiaceae bacterium]
MLDLDSLLAPVSPQAPSGPDLEYDASFSELERLTVGKPERQVGTVITPAEPPEWRAVVPKALGLLAASKDLRVAVHLARALLDLQSYRGFGDALALLHRLVAEHWDSVHPGLEPEDGDATRRLNVLASLVHRDLLSGLRVAPILVTRAAGDLQLRDVEALKAGRPLPGRPNAEAVVNAAPLDDLAAAVAAVDRCHAEAQALEQAWVAHLPSPALDLGELKLALGRAAEPLRARLAQARPAAAGAADPSTPQETGGAGGEENHDMTEIRSRDDVVRALDLICAYYARFEPSSPVPVLLERCKRLARMSFVDIVRELMPDGLAKIETIAGKPAQ